MEKGIVCSKTKYASSNFAEDDLENLILTYRRENVRRSYYCNICKSWHLRSNIFRDGNPDVKTKLKNYKNLITSLEKSADKHRKEYRYMVLNIQGLKLELEKIKNEYSGKV
ncbi:MAG: hypothetical protein ACUZ8H_16020 [Candidatus Anammoxibacter sp.]